MNSACFLFICAVSFDLFAGNSINGNSIEIMRDISPFFESQGDLKFEITAPNEPNVTVMMETETGYLTLRGKTWGWLPYEWEIDVDQRDHIFGNNTFIVSATTSDATETRSFRIAYGFPTRPMVTLVSPYLEMGQSFTLTCRARLASHRWATASLKYQWRLNDTVIEENVRTGSSSSDITVYELTKEMSDAKFQCVAWEHIKAKSFSEYYTLPAPAYGPDKVGFSVNESTTLTEGSTLEKVVCSSACNPPCQYTWTKNGQECHYSKGILYLENVTKATAGRYMCTARNTKTQRELSKTLVVDVGVKPIIASVTNDAVYEIGQTVNLECSADENKETPHVAWRNEDNGRQLSSGWRSNRWQMSAVKCADAGSYVCRASNIYGVTEKSVDVIVKCPPEELLNVTVPIDYSGRLGDPLVLSIAVSSYTEPTFTWSRLTANETTFDLTNWTITSENGTVSKLVIRNTTSLDIGSYRVTVTNGIPPNLQKVFNVTLKGTSSFKCNTSKTAKNVKETPVTWYVVTSLGGLVVGILLTAFLCLCARKRDDQKGTKEIVTGQEHDNNLYIYPYLSDTDVHVPDQQTRHPNEQRQLPLIPREDPYAYLELNDILDQNSSEVNGTCQPTVSGENSYIQAI